MKIHIDEITADIVAADFSTDAAALTFAAKMCSDYSARELFAYEDFLPRWSFNAIGEKQRFTRTWKHITVEARSLIVQVRTLGAGAIKNRLVCGAHGVELPHPQMCDDLDDDLFGMSIDALRRMAARAMENNATVQDVAKDAKRGADAAESADSKIKAPRADKGSKPKRTYRKAAIVDGVRLTAKWLAGVLNRAKFQPEKGAGWMGACTAKKIQQWDEWCADHPGEHNLWGYMTEFRTDEKRYEDLIRFCKNWDEFWKGYKAEFGRWRTKNPDTPRENFRPSRELMKQVDIDPDRMGEDEDGTMLIRPVSDDEKVRLRKVMCRKGLSRKHLGRQYQMN